ncbi:MAG: rhomboid family intramembrane serine protease [Planctomycetes bacterium]|nr:rhomboid family intramembrane serine protease [Planctomycetota bacterium]
MIIPWRVDVPQDRWPISNWLLILGIIAAFVFQTISIREQRSKLPDKIEEFANYSVEDVAVELGVDEQQLKEIERSVDKTFSKVKDTFDQKVFPTDFKDLMVKHTMLQQYFVWEKVRPFILDRFQLKGLFGHIWLHGGIIHLLGNLLFLWIFGNAVCAKIGNVAYLPIYIVLGVLAGIAHLVFQGGAVLGASGAIMGIVGIYLVFFPENEITCYFIFIFFLRPIIREFTLSSYWMILFWLAFDIFGATMEGGAIAYFAHLGGFAVGFGLAILMLKMKWVVMEDRYEKSLLQIWKGRNEPVPELYGSNHGMFPYNVETQTLETAKNAEQGKMEKKTVEVEKIPFGLEEPKDELIRFMCFCGKKVKAPVKYAGKVARCPRCKKQVKIPEKL